MIALDTGICAPESPETLRLQQQQLMRGTRDVQMFPAGTLELSIPDGCMRYVNDRGCYHFRPEKISLERLKELSSQGRENEFLKLGSFSKYDIAQRRMRGEKLICITEYSSSGVELRSAVGTNGTIDQQRKYFESTKEPGAVIVIGDYPERVRRHA